MYKSDIQELCVFTYSMTGFPPSLILTARRRLTAPCAVILELARESRGTKATALAIYTSTTRWFVAPRHSRACPLTGWRTGVKSLPPSESKKAGIQGNKGNTVRSSGFPPNPVVLPSAGRLGSARMTARRRCLPLRVNVCTLSPLLQAAYGALRRHSRACSGIQRNKGNRLGHLHINGGGVGISGRATARKRQALMLAEKYTGWIPVIPVTPAAGCDDWDDENDGAVGASGDINELDSPRAQSSCLRRE